MRLSLCLAFLLLSLPQAVHAQPGYGDLVFSSTRFFGIGETAGPAVCRNDGDGEFSCTGVGAAANDSPDVAAFDLDGDGDSDLVFADAGTATGSPGPGARLCVQVGDATGSFTCGAVDQDYSEVSLGVTTADLDGDGDVDLAFANPNEGQGYLCLQGGSGSGAFSCGAFGASSAYDVLSEDLDGDGTVDLAFGGDDDSAEKVCLNDGAAGLTCSSVNDVTWEAPSVAASDFDGDGVLDLAIAHTGFIAQGQQDRVCLSSGGAPLTFSCFSLGAYQSIGVVAGDFDGDGDGDLAFSGDVNSSQASRVCLNGGGASFTCTPLGFVSTGRVAAADLDGDGDQDLAFAGGTGSSRVCRQSGVNSGAFTCRVLSIETGAFGVAVGNFGGTRFPTNSEDGAPPDPAVSVLVRPNPTAGHVTVSFALADPAEVQIGVYDVLGRRVAHERRGIMGRGDQAVTLDGTRVPPGTYAVVIEAGGVRASTTVSVVRHP